MRKLVLNVQLQPAPGIETLTSSLAPDLPQTAVPQVSATAAADTAVNAVRASPSNVRRTPPPGVQGNTAPELVFFSPARFQLEGPTRLCWLVRIERTTVLIDATNGSVVHQYSDVMQ